MKCTLKCTNVWSVHVHNQHVHRSCTCAVHTFYVYGVATVSRLLKNTGLFCRISSLLLGSFAKETYNFKEPSNHSHPITPFYTLRVHDTCKNFRYLLQKEPNKRDDILQKRPIFLRSLLPILHLTCTWHVYTTQVSPIVHIYVYMTCIYIYDIHVVYTYMCIYDIHVYTTYMSYIHICAQLSTLMHIYATCIYVYDIHVVCTYMCIYDIHVYTYTTYLSYVHICAQVSTLVSRCRIYMSYIHICAHLHNVSCTQTHMWV